MKTIKTFVLILAVSLLVQPAAGQESQALKTGDKIPIFSLPDDNGDNWSVTDHIGTNTIIVFFYPAAMTGGCTKQACSYRDDQSKLKEAGAIVVGISGDESKNLTYFKKAHNLNFPLLSDKDGAVAKKFGVPLSEGGSIEQEIDGQTLQLDRGVTAKRWTFIADKDGEIRYINRSVDAENDSQNVLEVIAELNIK